MTELTPHVGDCPAAVVWPSAKDYERCFRPVVTEPCFPKGNA